jgi:hypothetical protein
MTGHKTGTREQWLAARLELLEAEKALTRRTDELAQQRHELPWVRIEEEYRLETDEGVVSLAELFGGRSQLMIYHFMFGSDYKAGCPSCSAIADGGRRRWLRDPSRAGVGGRGIFARPPGVRPRRDRPRTERGRDRKDRSHARRMYGC